MGSNLPYVFTETVKQVSTGQHHTCAIKNDDKLYCWGEGMYGRLGVNWNTDDKTSPTTTDNLGGDVKQVSCGAEHTCAI